MARLPKSFYNPVSLLGAGLALVTLGTIVVFFVVQSVGLTTSPYLGIFTYMILPAIMLIGLLIIPVGMWIDRRRERKDRLKEKRYGVIDFNNPPHRMAFMIFTVGTMLLIVISAAGTYQAYNYSESVEFCGRVCHEVMKPEFIAYQHSPHARVRCAECHIGEGADWFVKAKVSGLYQVYSVAFDKFSRPISTPITNLRPARETCERCHWPQKFSSSKEMAKTYYPLDTSATKPWSIVLNLRIGGGQSELGPTEGIHWHMNTENRVEYIATDDKRQVIPWVRSTNLKGITRIFKSTENSTADTTLAKGEKRNMDCIDCHNRPSHIYYPPFRTINDAMALNRIPNTLPNIRSITSSALTHNYRNEKDALDSIPIIIRQQYEQTAPQVLNTRAQEIGSAIGWIKSIYQRNFFSEMNVSWRAYPDNIGHLYNDGCFRCHDNKHIADDGTVLTNDCKICHTIVVQGPTGNVISNMNGMDFIHPNDIGEAWKESNCSTCHTGE